MINKLSKSKAKKKKKKSNSELLGPCDATCNPKQKHVLNHSIF